MTPSSPLPTQRTPTTLWALLESAARSQPRAVALIHGNDRHTYAQLHTQATALAAGLSGLGITRGDRVAIWLPNVPLWVVLQLACARIGDVLKLSGFMVSPVEIETTLMSYAGVEQCQVVGVPSERGQRAVAFVCCADAVDEAALMHFCGERMAHYKVPARIIRLDAFPLTVGANAPKVQKNRLREMALALLL